MDQIFKKIILGQFWALNPSFSYEHHPSGVQSEQAMNYIVSEGTDYGHPMKA